MAARSAGPCQQVSARVGLAAVRSRGLVVQLIPPLQPRVARVPDKPAVVTVSGRDHAAGPADPDHLPQGCDRIRDMLEHLMSVHDVE